MIDTARFALGCGSRDTESMRATGLATSGAGDVPAGLIGGLLARGTAPIDACLWGVLLHAAAGRRLGARAGSIGYRAGELGAEIPNLMEAMR